MGFSSVQVLCCLSQKHLERFRHDKDQARRKSRFGKSASLHSSPPRKFLRVSLDDNVGVANVETENSNKAEVSHLVSMEEF